MNSLISSIQFKKSSISLKLDDFVKNSTLSYFRISKSFMTAEAEYTRFVKKLHKCLLYSAFWYIVTISSFSFKNVFINWSKDSYVDDSTPLNEFLLTTSLLDFSYSLSVDLEVAFETTPTSFNELIIVILLL
ncbi:kinase-like protein [Gigaspora margarita]|uniref:Kinase-like protein n=1 Tax=Gigaspora margarita TaxID=4874 RepID=A0A8H4EQ73_GIGMA|nr:kinase-like protein [Gigaspora margarita]